MVCASSSILVLATGGTIAGQSGPEGTETYTSGAVGISTLLQSVGEYGPAAVHAEDIANIGSQDMNAQVWQQLHQRISLAFAQQEAKAVVITHGTDTLEETSFLLDLTLKSDHPVVLVGAMRPGDAPGADGPRVLLNALRTAAAEESQGRGVIVVSGDTLLSPRTVYKAATRGTDPMKSYPGGPLGWVSPTALQYFAPHQADVLQGGFSLPSPENWPRVVILYVCANMDPRDVEAVLASSPAGIVMAGVGHGDAPQWLLERLALEAGRGVPVIRATRINEGTVTRNLEVDDDAYGTIAGRNLNPQRCRLLLQLLLHHGVKGSHQIQKMFNLI